MDMEAVSNIEGDGCPGLGFGPDGDEAPGDEVQVVLDLAGGINLLRRGLIGQDNGVGGGEDVFSAGADDGAAGLSRLAIRTGYVRGG